MTIKKINFKGTNWTELAKKIFKSFMVEMAM